MESILSERGEILDSSPISKEGLKWKCHLRCISARLFRKMNIMWRSRSPDELRAGGMKEFNTRLLWAIPEDEEHSSKQGKHLIHLRKKTGIRSGHPASGCDCNCNATAMKKGMQTKLRFTSPNKPMRSRVRVSSSWPNTEVESNIKSTDDKYPVSLSFIPPRKRANEEELSYQCDEISQLYRAVSRGKQSQDNFRILGISLRI